MREFFKRARPQARSEWLALTVILALILSGALVIYWVHIDGNPPLVVYNEPLPVQHPQPDGYKPGDLILFHVVSCRRATGRITSTRRWVDGIMYVEPFQELAGDETECQSRDIAAVVPNIPPGIYHVEYNVSYQVNPLANRTVTFDTESFHVIADE